ncbi:LPS export ABC transporter periplasmic protein LptC [Pasteurellaceae bacterium Macca]|nr:LPS export ABC transporter periplasmic protein LptC [Pasteurellaceae bacterium Macca]
MNFRLNALLVLVVVALGAWFYQLQFSDSQNTPELIKKEGEPEYTGQTVTTTVYDLAGNPQYFAEAQEIKRYEHTERTEFFKPLLNLFNAQTALKQWKIASDHAEISKEKILTLSGNVLIESLDPTSRLQKIETEKLSIDLTSQDVFTDSPVISTGMGFTTSGVGLKGNLKRQVATLTKDVKTYIEPTIIRTAPSDANSKDKK